MTNQGAPSESAATQSMTIERLGQRDPDWPEAVEIFDTTLRDGSQFEGIALTADDKLRIAEQLDLLGVHYIEGRLARFQSPRRRVLRPGRLWPAPAGHLNSGGLRFDPAPIGQGR